ncbi:MAG TPA: hypothetical protein VGF75_05345, partial [Candidatus Saccharimonadales bacterium]
PWSGQTISAVASQPVATATWGGSQVSESVKLKPINVNAQQSQVVGAITTGSSLLKYSNTTAAILSQSPGSPSNWWVILHPQSFIHI